MSRNKVEIYLTEIEWKFTYSIGDGRLLHHRCYKAFKGIYHFGMPDYKMNNGCFYFRNHHIFPGKDVYLYIAEGLGSRILDTVICVVFGKFFGKIQMFHIFIIGVWNIIFKKSICEGQMHRVFCKFFHG